MTKYTLGELNNEKILEKRKFKEVFLPNTIENDSNFQDIDVMHAIELDEIVEWLEKENKPFSYGTYKWNLLTVNQKNIIVNLVKELVK